MKDMKQPQMFSYVSVGFLHQHYFMRRPNNTLNAELNPVCHFLALLEAHHILHVIRIGVKQGTAINLKCSNARELILYRRCTINHEMSVVYVVISTSS